jgi:hypothetical protein
VKNAKKDEGRRKDEPCAETDERGRARNDAETAPEGAPVNVIAMRENQRHAGDEKKGEGDRMAEGLHRRRPWNRMRDIAEMGQVPDQVKGDHRHDGETTRGVEGAPAPDHFAGPP